MGSLFYIRVDIACFLFQICRHFRELSVWYDEIQVARGRIIRISQKLQSKVEREINREWRIQCED